MVLFFLDTKLRWPNSKVVKNAGLQIWMLELLYDKYRAPFDISRDTLFDRCVVETYICSLV